MKPLCIFLKIVYWKSEDKLVYLGWALTEIAAQLFWGTEDLNYEQPVEKLRSRFGGAGLEEKPQNELRFRRCSKGETA